MMKTSEPEIFTKAAVFSAPGSIVSEPIVPDPLTPEDQARADFYALIARLFLHSPDASLLQALAQADSLASEQIDNPLEAAWEKLIMAASATDAQAVQEEFSALFISIGNPPVNPYASVYLSGFMMEKPLAYLRNELAALGLARMVGKGELEDHIGALCETMRILIAGTEKSAGRPLQAQRRFFLQHISPWYVRCLDDIRQCKTANFYRHVADLAQAFFEIEFQAFELDEDCLNEA